MTTAPIEERVARECIAEIAAVARHYGAEVPFLRPAAFSGDTSPDIEWVEHALSVLEPHDCFAILRPTSPLLSPSPLQSATYRFHRGSQQSGRSA